MPNAFNDFLNAIRNERGLKLWKFFAGSSSTGEMYRGKQNVFGWTIYHPCNKTATKERGIVAVWDNRFTGNPKTLHITSDQLFELREVLTFNTDFFYEETKVS